MRKQTITLGAFVLISLALLTPAQAANNLYAGVQLGSEFLTDDDNLDDAFAFGVYGGYHFDRLLSLEASLTTASHDGPGGYELDVTSLLIGPRLTGQVSRNLNLYGGVGLGFHFLDPEWGDDDTETGMYLGGGIEFPLQNNINLGMDLKYHVIFDDDEMDSDLVTLLLRLGF